MIDNFFLHKIKNQIMANETNIYIIRQQKRTIMFAIYFFNALVYKEYLEIDKEKTTY